ncbi:MAG: lamin tail domain-containing protein [bacterium]|nr:lamin tail domain-containing protein [bacterium]
MFIAIVFVATILWGNSNFAEGLEVLPDTLDFGPGRIGSTLMDTVAIRNIDLVPLLVEAVGLSGAIFKMPGEPFSGDTFILQPGQTFPFAMSFAPTDTLSYEEKFVLQTPSASQQVVVLGKGVRSAVVINEVLADPPAGDAGDANRDGVRHSSEDEFVEIVNLGKYPLDIGGWQLSDVKTSPGKRFSFPVDTQIGPGGRITLFGGGNPSGIPGQVFTDDGKIGGGLRNSGDEVLLIDPSGLDTLSRFAYGKEGGKDRSLVRYPEGTGLFQFHTLFPGMGDLFSPGSPRLVLVALEIAPFDTALALGDTVIFQVLGRFAAGEPFPIEAEATWKISDPEKLVWDGKQATAARPGEVTVVACIDDLQSPAIRVIIEGPSYVRMELMPADTLVVAGDTLRYWVEGVLSDSTRVNIEEAVQWTWSDSLIARLIAPGVVRTTGAGEGTVGVIWESMHGTARLQIGDLGDLNADGMLDLPDAIRLVHLILEEPPPPTRYESRAANLNGDDEVNILDLARFISRILDLPEGGSKPVISKPAIWETRGTVLQVQAPNGLRTLSFEVAGLVQDLEGLAQDQQVFMTHKNATSTEVVVFSLGDRGLIPSKGYLKISLVTEEGEGLPGVDNLLGTDLLGRAVAFERVSKKRVPASIHSRPNPFNPTTTLSYFVPQAQRVRIRVFSCLGQEVVLLRDQFHGEGTYQVLWDGKDGLGHPVGSGLYLGVLETEGAESVIKMVLMK